MPKYCCVPTCRTESGICDSINFYEFPLHNPDQLQQWLRNMGLENWTPSRNQYICHEHFGPWNFQVQHGFCCLENDAVPTLVQQGEKRKATEQSQGEAKRFWADSDQSVMVFHDWTNTADGAELEDVLDTVRLFEITIDSLDRGETSLLELSEDTECDSCVQTDLNPHQASGDESETEDNILLTLVQTLGDVIDHQEDAKVEEELVNNITAAILTQTHKQVRDDDTPEASLSIQDVTTEESTGVHEDNVTGVIRDYFKMISNVFPCEMQTMWCPQTMVSSSLSSKPITFPLPMVSRHFPSSATSITTVRRLDVKEEGEEDDRSFDMKVEEEDNDGCFDIEDREDQDIRMHEGSFDGWDHQLENHCYHRNSLTKQQLEAIVSELKMKVMVLQQRHHWDQEKVLDLENTVSQLRQSNQLHQERLNLLEEAYIQTRPVVPDVAEIHVDVYSEDEDTAAYF